LLTKYCSHRTEISTKDIVTVQPIKITKPEWILFADESGFNTSQKKDGHVGGQKFAVERGTTPQTMASKTDHRSLQHLARQFVVQ
jgi:hypothetical protein